MPVLPHSISPNDGEIFKPKLLLVEGKDEISFFRSFLSKHKMDNDVQIIDVGGVEKFKTELPALINRTGFSDLVESIALVRDADANFDGAFQSACDVIKKNGFVGPKTANTFSCEGEVSFGIFIMPGNPEDGTMLEDLCLKTKNEDPVMNCVNQFFECVGSNTSEFPRNLSKAKVQVYLATKPKIVNSLGLGAQKHYWDLEHDSLLELKNFLQQL
ncbi:DUF3226 domain-containing protein [Bacillus sp. SIMBA_074]|uniref:DUF3226 domain-containing protein n=1 Tax=Bacillus sp. SIMBA_074 TaxID=3085812 RepID=UPI00397A001D